MTTGKGMRNYLLKAVGNTGDRGQVPLFLASQPLAVFLRSKGRWHPPQINNMLLFLSYWHPFISSPVPYMQAQTSSALKFPTIHQITKLDQPKLLEDFWQVRSFYLKHCLHWCLNFVLAFFAPLFTRLMNVWGKDVSEACVVCSWETFELVAEQKVGHKHAGGSHSSWPWKRGSESSQPTEGNITLEDKKVKEKLQPLNNCLGMWCKLQRTKWTNWMTWKWTNTLCTLIPCLCLTAVFSLFSTVSMSQETYF